MTYLGRLERLRNEVSGLTEAMRNRSRASRGFTPAEVGELADVLAEMVDQARAESAR